MLSSSGSMLRKFLPKSLRTYLAWMRQREYESKQYWRGIYANLEEVPRSGSGYFSEQLASETFDSTKKLLESVKEGRTLPFSISEENALLPLVASVLAEQKNELSVMDLGGGMGVGFLALRGCLPSLTNIRYWVIETPVMCQGGKTLFAGDERIQFYSDFPPLERVIDVVYVKSALQYFEDYAGVLRKLAGYGPRYFFFAKLAAGDIKTYATGQTNLSGTVTPCWFFNIGEIVNLMRSLGYTLIYKGVMDRIYNQENFPVEYRLGKNCNLLFVKG